MFYCIPDISLIFRLRLEEAARGGRRKYMENILESDLSHYETDACDGCGYHSSFRMERRNDTACHHGRDRTEYPAVGTAQFPDTVWNQL